MTTATLDPTTALGCDSPLCEEPATHMPCCSSHQRALCCRHYCNRHFVEVGRCSPEDHQ
jgi:hypothetical protein